MDAYEATRVVFSRIQALDPENAAKIMGLLLIQDHGEKEMIRLAFGPETLLHSVILKARKELGLLHPSSSSSAAAAAAATTPSSPSPSPFLLSRQNSFRNSAVNSSTGCLSPSSLWAPQALPFSRSNSSSSEQQQQEVVQGEQQMMLNNDYLLQEQLSFLNKQQQQQQHQIGGGEGGVYWGDQHQRACLSPDGSGFAWKPCLYFARGFCKNGSSCRFLHGPADDISAAAVAVEQQCQELMLMRSKSQRLMSSAAVAAAAAFPYSPTGSSAANKGFNLMMQQSESQQRAAAVAAAMMLEGENKFMGRVRMERSDFAGMVNPGSRQIYLTFPADSTFREEDVSNYFSIYGPVQDVRIPYQQKRMFGFVTFVYPETVKLILAKGNPHFVCDARVLVKPYKEKGKVPDKKLQQGERVDFAGCGTPTGLDSRDPYDLQQLANSRLLLYGSNSQEALLRRKMEEQQAAAELQQAIEMQGRRFMGLQLLDLKNRNMPSPSSNGPLLSPLATTPSSTTFMNNHHHHNTGPLLSDGNGSGRSSSGTSQDETTGEDKSLSPASGNASAISNADADNKQQPAVKSEQRAIATVEPNLSEDIHFQERGGAEIHNLPDSPFASPTKSSFLPDPFALAIDDEANGNGNGHLIASSLLSPSSPLENMASFKSCYFQMPRYSSGHGAVGL